MTRTTQIKNILDVISIKAYNHRHTVEAIRSLPLSSVLLYRKERFVRPVTTATNRFDCMPPVGHPLYSAIPTLRLTLSIVCVNCNSIYNNK